MSSTALPPKRDKDDVLAKRKGLSAQSMIWDTDQKGFLTDEERALRNMDTAGTGSLTAKQLSAFADQHGALRKEMKQLKRNFLGLAGVTLLLFVGTVVASYFAFEASKDSRVDPQTGIMMTYGTNSPVSTNTNELEVPLAALPFLPGGVADHVRTLSFAGPVQTGGTSADGSTDGGSDGDPDTYRTRYHRTVRAIDVVPSAGLSVRTTEGDSLVWPGAGGAEADITVTLADGTTWNKPALCAACVAANVRATDENRRGVGAFLERVGSARRVFRALAAYDKENFDYSIAECQQDELELYEVG